MLDRILDTYSQSFDITKEYAVGSTVYDAYGYCNITNSKYVLVKKAELWRALCFEHVFFRKTSSLTASDIDTFLKHTAQYIEPVLVRKGRKHTEKDHMYSYITGIFICENGISAEIARLIKKKKFHKNYMLSICGFCELRLLAVDLKNGRIIGNSAARDLVKDYKKYLSDIK